MMNSLLNSLAVISLKMGAQTAEANINAGIAAAHQIEGFLKEGIEKFRVNK